MLPLYVIDPSNLSKKINKFCEEFPVMKMGILNEEDMEKVALTAAKGMSRIKQSSYIT